MMVPILKQGHVLIATIMAALSDEDMRQFREALLDRVVTSRATAVIIDVMAMDVLDSFAGSGTSGEAAALHGRSFVLIDASPEAVQVMARRLARFAPEHVGFAPAARTETADAERQ